jgi:hypothetical protein
MKKLLLFALLAAGCGGDYLTNSTPMTSVTQNARVTGQYDLLLTSTNGHSMTNIYSNFTQTGTTFTGSTNTLVCPSNDLSQCGGNDASITPSGTVSGQNVTMTISFPSTAGADTLSMIGSATGPDLAGTYTDSLGEAGTWTAVAAGTFSGSYSGTFNSTSNPLPIAPTFLMTLGQDARFNLTGTATIMNSPCISSLTFLGQAIGGAFSLTDRASGAVIIGVPNGNGFDFHYNFAPTAARCAGDFGVGTVSNTSGPFDY